MHLGAVVSDAALDISTKRSEIHDAPSYGKPRLRRLRSSQHRFAQRACFWRRLCSAAKSSPFSNAPAAMVSMNAQIAPVAPSTSSNNKRGKVIDWAALALAVGIISPIRLRPFLPVHDQPAIESICASVHCAIDIESGDYLPGLAASMAADPACSLLVLTENDDVVSVANVKRLTPSISWLEAVRTSPERRGRGLASRLCSAHTAVAAAEGRRLLSATVSSNHGMQKAFARCGACIHSEHLNS